jgi:hypothetical protein
MIGSRTKRGGRGGGRAALRACGPRRQSTVNSRDSAGGPAQLLTVDCRRRRRRPEAGLLRFLLVHRKQLVASPVLLGQMTKAFVSAVEAFAQRHSVPLVHFEKGQRKEDVAQQHFARAGDKEGVVFIGVAQEKVLAPSAPFTVDSPQSTALCRNPSTVDCQLSTRAAGPQDFGPAFIKFSTYFPFTVRVWINGHEWAKRQLARKGIVFEALDNGSLSVGDAARAQHICDRLDADRIDAFFRKWLARLPHPLRACGPR